MKKVAFRNLGCKVNEYELEFMQQKMSESGFSIVPFDTKADIYVINTCTVTNIADRKSRQMLHKAKKENPEALVVAVGCYVQTDESGAEKDSAVDIIIGNNNKARIADIISDYLKDHSKNRAVEDLRESVRYEDMRISKTMEHTRAFMKIQDGCNQFCSYCAIPLARGRIRSRKPEDTVSEARLLADNGYKEVVLTGIHLSSYGIDFHKDENGKIKSYNELVKDGKYTNSDLLDIINKVAAVEGIKRIRLGSLEPRLITEEFARKLSEVPKLCPHFHLSLQSGCDETLKRMNRHYTTEEYMESLSILRKYFDMPAITTDVIVGFPQETDEEFEKTRKFIEQARFFELHVFKYSKRKNTVAAGMSGQVTEDVKSERSDILIKLDEVLSDEFRRNFINRETEVLFEEEKNGVFEGHTREYVKVGMKSDKNLKGQILRLSPDGESLFFI